MRRLLFIFTLLAASLVAGYGSPVSQAQDAPPALTVSEGDVIWNDVALGTTETRTVTVSNTGGGTVGIVAPVIGGGDSADFSVASTTCTGARLAAGQTCAVTVGFTPKAKSTRVSHLRIASDIANCTVWPTLAGTGAATTSAGHAEKHSGFAQVCGSAPAQTPAAPGTTVINQTSGVLGSSESGGTGICQSRRVIRIHWKAPKGKALSRRGFSVKTKGRTFKAKYIAKGKRQGQYYADLSFKGLKVGRYSVKISGKLTSGKAFKRTRHFVTCISGKTP